MTSVYLNPRAAARDPYRYEPEEIASTIARAKRDGADRVKDEPSPRLHGNIARLQRMSADDLSRGGSAFTAGAVQAVKP